MKSIYTIIFIIIFIVKSIDSLKSNSNNGNNNNNIYSTSSGGDTALTISIVVNQESILPYNSTECGSESLPCKSFSDAGESARYLLNSNKDSLIPLNLVIQLNNLNYYLSDSGVFGNLYGFCDIGVRGIEQSLVTIDGTNYFPSTSSAVSFFTIRQPDNYILPKYRCGFLRVGFNRFTFQNIYLPSYLPIISIDEQLPNQFYNFIYLNIFGSTFLNINSPIIKSQNQQPNNSSSNNNNNNNNLNPNNYNMVVIVSSCTFNGISSLYDGYSTSPAMLHIESGVLQILSSSIQNVTFTKSSPQFIYLYNGSLKIFQSLFRYIHSSSLLSFITTLESAYSIQIDTVTFRDNQIGKWLEINQTTITSDSSSSSDSSVSSSSNNSMMDIIFITDTDFYNNQFQSLYNNNNFIIVNLNQQHNRLVFNNLKFYNNKLFDSNQIASSSSSSSSASPSNFKLAPTSSFIYLQGPTKLSTCEFRDDLDEIFLLYLNQTNLEMKDSILLSIDPIGGTKSNVTMDNLSFISESGNLFYCQECLFNGSPPQKPSLISTTTAILLILGLLVVLGVLGVLYVKFVHVRVSNKIKQNIKKRKQKRFMHLDGNLTSALDSQTESLLSNYDNDDDHFSINSNNNNNNSSNDNSSYDASDSYSKFKVVGDLE